MKRCGRVRGVAKWAGLVACMLTALIWLSSPFWFVQRIRESYGGSLGGMTVREVGAGSGFVWFSWVEVPSRRSYLAERMTMEWRAQRWLTWRPTWRFENSAILRGLDLAVPLWMPFLAAALPTGWLWWRDRRRARPGHCVACGYDLAGLAAGAACPECGASSIRGDSLRHGGPSARTPLPEKSP